jgi:hypothetical protein
MGFTSLFFNFTNFIELIIIDYGDAFFGVIKETTDCAPNFNVYTNNYKNQLNSTNYSFILDDKNIKARKNIISDLNNKIKMF